MCYRYAFTADYIFCTSVANIEVKWSLITDCQLINTYKIQYFRYDCYWLWKRELFKCLLQLYKRIINKRPLFDAYTSTKYLNTRHWHCIGIALALYIVHCIVKAQSNVCFDQLEPSRSIVSRSITGAMHLAHFMVHIVHIVHVVHPTYLLVFHRFNATFMTFAKRCQIIWSSE